MFTETSDFSVLQEKLEAKEKEFLQHKELEKKLALELEKSLQEKHLVASQLQTITSQQEAIKKHLEEERAKV